MSTQGSCSCDDHDDQPTQGAEMPPAKVDIPRIERGRARNIDRGG